MTYILFKYKRDNGKRVKVYFRGYKEATFYTDILTERRCQATQFIDEEANLSEDNARKWTKERL